MKKVIKKDPFQIRVVKPEAITGAGLTLTMGHVLGPFIPFNKLKNWRFK